VLSLQESPDTVLSVLNALGVDAYRGATQLNIIEPEPESEPQIHSTSRAGAATKSSSHLDPMTLASMDPRYPAEARYLIDHVIYLPVSKRVPFHVLNKICRAVKHAIKCSKDAPEVRLRSKL